MSFCRKIPTLALSPQIEAAAKEMTLFNKQREAGRLSQQEKNRHEETAVLETLERDLEVKEGDNPWSRVARLVEMVSKVTRCTRPLPQLSSPSNAFS